MQLQLHELHYNLGHVLHEQEDLLGAIASYRQAIALCPNHINAHYNLAVALDEQGKTAAAIASYRQVIFLHEQSQQFDSGSNSNSKSDSDLCNAYVNLCQILIQHGQLDEAIQTCQQALSNPTAELCCCLGQALEAQGKLSQAIATYQQAVSLKPDLSVAHYRLGKVWQQQGQHAAAVVCFQRVIQLQPEQVEVYGDCSVALMALGEFSEAMLCWQRAIALQQIFVEAFCKRVAALTELDELTQAKIACGQFLNRLQHQADEPVYVYLQQTYLHLANALTEYGGDSLYRQAETYYRQALQLQSQASTLHLRLENCLDQQQRSPVPPQLHKTDRTEAWITAHPGDRHRYIALTPYGVSTNPLSPPISPCVYSVAPTPPPIRPCLGLNCPPCLSQIFRSFELTHLGKGIYTCIGNAIATELTPLFVSAIAKGKAWIAPQTNYWKICNAIAIFAPDDCLLTDLSREYPGQLPGCQHPQTHQRAFDLSNFSTVEPIKGKVAVLSGLSGHVYFHWMVDVLPRLALLRWSGWDEIDYFLVNSYQQAFQQETLVQLGIPLEKVVESDRHPHLQADLLVVPSFAGPLGWLQPWAIEFLRNTFLPQNLAKSGSSPGSSKYSERVYISRSQARYRNVLNEPEIIHLLKQYGFSIIALESLAFEQQIALFAAAKVIVAPHGSGLTNIVFCSPNTKVIELVSPHYIRHYYWVISRYLQLEHYYLAGEGFDCQPLRELMYQNPLTEDILVNLDALQTALKQIDLSPI